LLLVGFRRISAYTATASPHAAGDGSKEAQPEKLQQPPPHERCISTKESRSLEEHPGLSAYKMAVHQAIIQ
jgi:hypothetical protein